MSVGKFNIELITIQFVVQCSNIWCADNPVEVLNEHILLLVGRFVPTKGKKDKPWFDDQCRYAFGAVGGTVIALGLTGESFSVVQRANETYSEAKRQFSARNRDVLMNAQAHRWSSILKSAVFGLLVEVVDWCASRLSKLICSRIMMASSPGSLLICRSLEIGLRDLPPLPSGRVRSGVSCLTWTLRGLCTVSAAWSSM